MWTKIKRGAGCIQSSLDLKIFLATFCLLMGVGAIIYGSVMIAMPNTYQARLDDKLVKKLDELKVELKNVEFDDVAQTINQFMANNYVDLILLDSEKKIVQVPNMWTVVWLSTDGKQYYEYAINTKDENYMEQQGKLLPTGYSLQEAVQFKNSSDIYYLEVANDQYVVRQASEILMQLLPIMLGLIALIALGTAYIYAHCITRPIKKVSQTASRMATLDLSTSGPVSRTDEIGVLMSSLNEMASKLSNTLTSLEAANHQLEADIDKERTLEQKRRAFFAAVSHELKTPITIIKGQLEGMIYKVGVYKDRDTYLQRALMTIDHMEEMVQEILSISRLGSDSFSLKKEPTPLFPLVMSCIENVQELAQEKQIILEKQFELKEAQCEVDVDRKLMKKVISNLLSNGIQHSPAGEKVTIGLGKKQDYLELSIENTGVHIAEEEMEKIFEPFYRVEKSRNRHMGGTGLGLYIVKLILDMHKSAYEMSNTKEGVRFKINFTENTN